MSQPDTIKVGTKDDDKKVVIKVSRPENTAECLALCGNDEKVLAQRFWRGHSIAAQDSVLRPAHTEGKTADEMQAIYDSWDGISSQRAPRGPKRVTFTQEQIKALGGRKVFEPLKAQLLEQGVEVVEVK